MNSLNDLLTRFWSNLDPGLADPVWLIMGLLAVIAIILLEVGAARRRAHALAEFLAPHLVQVLTASVSYPRRWLKRVLLIAAVFLLFAALARPLLFYGWDVEHSDGTDILLAVDCSKSMLTQDVKPSRLELAKLAISDFADHLAGSRLGLISFAGEAFLSCPLTLDHGAFQDAVRDLDTDSLPVPGTDIATAIHQAMEALQNQPDNRKVLVLITDGEDLEGHVLDAAKEAAAVGLKVYCIGVGTPGGDLIPLQDDSGQTAYLRDSAGELVHSRLDEDTLKKIAALTGGAYVQLGQQGQGLQEIYDRYLAQLPTKDKEERREKVRYEQFSWPLGLAILLLIAEFLIRERAAAPKKPFLEPGELRPAAAAIRRRKAAALATAPLFALTLLLPSALHAADTAPAERNYQDGHYDDSQQGFQHATQDDPTRPEYQFDLGDAAYKAGHYTDAQDAFRRALQTPDLNLQQRAYYNLGNTLYRHGEEQLSSDQDATISSWKAALDSYRAALQLKDDPDAQYNYDLVKKRLEELKKQQQQKPKDSKQNQQQQQQNGQNQQQTQQNSSGGQPQNQPQNGQNPSPAQPQNQNGQANNQGQNQPGQSQGQGQQQPAQAQPGSSTGAHTPEEAQQMGQSQARAEDKVNPGLPSRQEAEALLDSLKDEEHHLTAKDFNKNNPPPPPSGKDW